MQCIHKSWHLERDRLLFPRRVLTLTLSPRRFPSNTDLEDEVWRDKLDTSEPDLILRSLPRDLDLDLCLLLDLIRI